MPAPTPEKAPGAAEAPPGANHRASGQRSPASWRLFGWILIPAVLAVGLAVMAMGWSAPAAGSTEATAAPSPSATLAPTSAPANTATALPATVAPTAEVAQVLATDTAPPPTPDAAAAFLTQLPATLPVVATATGEVIAPIPTDAPDVDETPSGDRPLPTFTPAPPSAPPTSPPAASGPSDPITGLPADPALLARVPIVVMIDNHPDAAPQTGLNSASMVIESLAEGGITRFESVFLTGSAPTVGPVRSARPYFVEWAYPFTPLYVHCGGSGQAIELIQQAANILTNVDCFNGKMPFWRSNARLMPHNLYSSTTDLWKMAANEGRHAPKNEPGFQHTTPLPPDQRPQSASVSFVFSSLSRSDITWIYDHDNNRYLRKQWGGWHRDAATGEIINASDVVILWTSVWALPGDVDGRLGTDTTGQGTALILHDGLFEWGSWVRPNPYTPLSILDGKHQPMRFTPGRIWIEALPIGRGAQIGH